MGTLDKILGSTVTTVVLLILIIGLLIYEARTNGINVFGTTWEIRLRTEPTFKEGNLK